MRILLWLIDGFCRCNSAYKQPDQLSELQLGIEIPVCTNRHIDSVFVTLITIIHLNNYKFHVYAYV